MLMLNERFYRLKPALQILALPGSFVGGAESFPSIRYIYGMSKTFHAFDFLDPDATLERSPFFVLFGDDRFLQLRVKKYLLSQLASEEAEFDVASFDGDAARWADVNDQLSTRSLFSQGSDRLAIVENGDGFVKKYRGELEDLVAKPPSTGCLILLVGTWPGNTRLYKSLDKKGFQIHCGEPVSKRGRSKSPDTGRIVKWIAAMAKTDHGLNLTQALARQLLEIVEWNLGRADQELAKLSLFAGKSGKVTEEEITSIVGGWRAQSIWDAAAAATQGKTDEALQHLANLLQSGEHPLALYGQLSWSLRRYGRLWEGISRQTRNGRKPDLSVSLNQAGFRQWGGEMDVAGSSVKQLGRQRVKQFYQWLLETDLSLKGTHSDPTRARFALEQLFFRMAKLSA